MGILEILEASNKFSKEIVDNHMKTIKELEAIKYNEKGYAQARIILRDRKEVLEVIDEWAKKCNYVKEDDWWKELEQLKARINGK